jgi:serine/threonine-protein kinase
MEPSTPRIVLEIVAGPHRGRRLEFDQHDTLLVGRGSAARLRLTEDPHFSRHHFLLEINPPRAYLRDLASRNGTLVNGRPVKEHHLSNGEVISGGKTQIRFTAFDADLGATADFPRPRGDSLDRVETVSLGPEPTPAHGASLPTPAAVPRPPAEGVGPALAVPGYHLLRRLGKGGMGTVYLARHQHSQELIALKTLIPESAASDRALNLFLREARVLSQLRHPCIVRFRDFGMARGQVYILMDYVETVDLPDLLRQKTEAERVGLATGVICQVLAGLHYAHGLGFVHRDVKPGNVLTRREGGGLHALLADFGLAKNYENAGLSGMTREGQALGTLAFMAPEQLVNARDARPAADVYSAAATLYHLLSGKLPYDFPPGHEPVLVVLEAPVVPLGRRMPSLPPVLADVVQRALARDPGARFPTAEALRQALLTFAAAVP